MSFTLICCSQNFDDIPSLPFSCGTVHSGTFFREIWRISTLYRPPFDSVSIWILSSQLSDEIHFIGRSMTICVWVALLLVRTDRSDSLQQPWITEKHLWICVCVGVDSHETDSLENERKWSYLRFCRAVSSGFKIEKAQFEQNSRQYKVSFRVNR